MGCGIFGVSVREEEKRSQLEEVLISLKVLARRLKNVGPTFTLQNDKDLSNSL